MQNKADLIYKDNKLFITGELNFFNVMSVYKKSLTFFKNNSELHFDFSSLKSSNSAALALIIEWIKCGEDGNKPIHFENISQDLMTIAKAAGIDKMILSHLFRLDPA